jgi:hypothetical protein
MDIYKCPKSKNFQQIQIVFLHNNLKQYIIYNIKNICNTIYSIMLALLFTRKTNKNKIITTIPKKTEEEKTQHEKEHEPHECNCDLEHENLLQLGKNNYELYDIVKDIRNNIILTDAQINYIKTLNKCDLLKIIKLSNFCNYMLKSQFLPMSPPITPPLPLIDK